MSKHSIESNTARNVIARNETLSLKFTLFIATPEKKLLIGNKHINLFTNIFLSEIYANAISILEADLYVTFFQALQDSINDEIFSKAYFRFQKSLKNNDLL